MKTIMVTGASSGLGKAIVDYFLSERWQVVACMRNTSMGDYLKGNKKALVVEMDVTDRDQVKRAAALAAEKFGAIDVLFNAAGFGGVFMFEDKDEDYFDRQMNTNFNGTVNTTRAVLPYMRNKRKGHIINVTSIAGKAGIPFQTAYVASKHAVSGFTDALAYEVKHFGINMTIFEVGGMNTGFVAAMDNADTVEIEDYKAYFKRVSGNLARATENAYKNAPTPDIVAKEVKRLVDMKAPPVFFRPTRDSRIMEILRRFLPRKRFRKIMTMGLE